MAGYIRTKKDKIADIIDTLIREQLADPVRLLTDTDYAVDRVLLYIEAANMARAMLNRPLINLNDYPDE